MSIDDNHYDLKPDLGSSDHIDITHTSLSI
jgi:hypothetical protein